MARPRLDLLPLLDVFMVVLFVFATIQEQRLDTTTRGRDELQRRVSEVEQVLRESQAHEQQRDLQHEVRSAALLEQRDAVVAELMAESEHLRRELQEARESMAENKDKVRRELEQLGVPEEALRRVDVLQRVLDKYSVFEIEIAGVVADDRVTNRCCFRVDPLADGWQPCGEIPGDAEARERWLDEGAGGLVDALRRTKGGNAMTLVRQDTRASHRLATRLVEQLRDRFTDQHFYAEHADELPGRCGG